MPPKQRRSLSRKGQSPPLIRSNSKSVTETASTSAVTSSPRSPRSPRIVTSSPSKKLSSPVNVFTKHLPAPLVRFVDGATFFGDYLERSIPSSKSVLHAISGLALVSFAILLYAGAAETFQPVFGLSYKTPLIGPCVLQVQLLMYSWYITKAILGPGIIGLILAYWGHPIVYLAAFSFYFVKISFFYSVFIGVIMLFTGRTGAAWELFLPLVPLPLVYLQSYGNVHQLADAFPSIAAAILVSALCFFDQSIACLITNIAYNRLVWFISWKSFFGFIRFPLLFCYDSRAHGGKQNWGDVGFKCPSYSTHSEALQCICKYDLACSTADSSGDCATFCDKIAGDSNIVRLHPDYNICLSIGHCFFCALVFSFAFHALHKAQRTAIVNMTAAYGMFLAGPTLASFNYFGIVTCFSYSAAVLFQTTLSCRLTRILCLDVSPPDTMPTSFPELFNAMWAFARTVVVSMPVGLFFPVFMYFVRLEASSLAILNGVKAPLPVPFCGWYQ